MLRGTAPTLTDDPIDQRVQNIIRPSQIDEGASAHGERFDPCFDLGFNWARRDEGAADSAGPSDQAWAPCTTRSASVPDDASIKAWRMEGSKQVRPISASVAKWDSGSPVGEISKNTSRT